MISMRFTALLTATVIVLSTVGALVSLVVGLLATPRVLVPGAAAFALIALLVGVLSLFGIRSAGGTDTAYW